MEQSPEEVLREYGVVPGEGVTAAALVKVLLADELTDTELTALAGGADGDPHEQIGWDLT